MITLTINGTPHSVDPNDHGALLDFIRNSLGLTGTKTGCAMGDCGACTVVVDGAPLQACQLSLSAVAETRIETIEHIVQTPLGARIAAALTEHQAAQCGYCLPGITAAAYGRFGTANRLDPAAALEGNLCRCGTHTRILKALNQVKIALEAGE